MPKAIVTTEQEPAQYRVKAPTYLDRLYAVDAVITYAGVPNRALEPLNEAAEEAVEAAAKARSERPQPARAPGLVTSETPRTADAPKGVDVKALTKRAEDAEFTVAERDEEIVRLNAELRTVTEERNVLAAAAEAGKGSDAKE